MTLREKVEGELRNAEQKMEEQQRDIAEEAKVAAECAPTDALGMTPGLGLSHAALNIAIYGARAQELRTRINMLEWLLRDDPSDEG